jgi:hypothetical protein
MSTPRKFSNEVPFPESKRHPLTLATLIGSTAITALLALSVPSDVQAQEKRPNIVMLMTDDTGWGDFGAYSGGGAGLGHPTPNIDRIAKEGATFTSWYGQASCTAGRASFITGAHPDAHSAVDRGGPGRRELSPSRDANHC